MASVPLDVKNWQNRAEEAHLIAEQMADAETRGMMLEIAAAYDKIADRARE